MTGRAGAAQAWRSTGPPRTCCSGRPARPTRSPTNRSPTRSSAPIHDLIRYGPDRVQRASPCGSCCCARRPHGTAAASPGPGQPGQDRHRAAGGGPRGGHGRSTSGCRSCSRTGRRLGTGSPTDAAAAEQARFNATLQIGYFLIGVRAAGLAAGPMAGSTRDGVDAEFFAGRALAVAARRQHRPARPAGARGAPAPADLCGGGSRTVIRRALRALPLRPAAGEQGA